VATAAVTMTDAVAAAVATEVAVVSTSDQLAQFRKSLKSERLHIRIKWEKNESSRPQATATLYNPEGLTVPVFN
jgi:hypothetical protein